MNFCAPWKKAWSEESDRSNLITSAPTSSWSTIDAVTMGPIPSKINEFDAPAKKARYCSNKSIESADNPNKGTLASAKYSTSTPNVHIILVLKCTWPSGLATAGNFLNMGSKLSLKLIIPPFKLGDANTEYMLRDN